MYNSENELHAHRSQPRERNVESVRIRETLLPNVSYRIVFRRVGKRAWPSVFGVQPRQSVAHWHQSLSGIHYELPRYIPAKYIYWTLSYRIIHYSSHLDVLSYPYFLYGFIFRLVFPLTWFDFPCRATVPAVYFLPAVNQSIYSTGKLNWIVVSLFLTQQNCISHRFRPPRPNGWFWSNFFFSHRPDWLLLVSPNSWTNPSCVRVITGKRQDKKKEIPGSLTPGHQLSNWTEVNNKLQDVACFPARPQSVFYNIYYSVWYIYIYFTMSNDSSPFLIFIIQQKEK